jgi:2-C-methyl-D-erythritol 4-phosphate cytidylyltransferase
MYVTAIVLAAGKGLRFKSRTPKALAEINSKPIIIYSLNTLNKHPQVKDIIVVANYLNFREIKNKIKKYRVNKIKEVVLGGRERQDSVINGLKKIDKRTELVLIHDGVRPFIDKAMVSAVIKEADRCGAARLGVPVKATIKEAHGSWLIAHRNFIVKKTLNRENLWEIQTPQAFRKELILKAYDKFSNTRVTDDASLVERLGAKVRLVLGSYSNIKITTVDDLIIAEAVAKGFA